MAYQTLKTRKLRNGRPFRYDSVKGTVAVDIGHVLLSGGAVLDEYTKLDLLKELSDPDEDDFHGHYCIIQEMPEEEEQEPALDEKRLKKLIILKTASTRMEER